MYIKNHEFEVSTTKLLRKGNDFNKPIYKNSDLSFKPQRF